MAQESLLNTNWNSGDEIAATELNTHGQEHLDLDGHGDAFHAVQYVKSLAGGNGIDPSSIGDGDTLSINLSDIAGNNLSVDTTNNELDASGGGGISSLSGGNGIDPNSIGDGDTLSIDLSNIAGNNLSVDTTNNELDATGGGISSLSGGNGIDPDSIGDGDTISINLSDIAGNNLSVDTTNNELDASGGGGISSLSGGDGIDPRSIGDGDTLSVTWSDATDLNKRGDIDPGVVSEPELNVDPFSYDPGITEFESGLSNEEINRTVLQSGEQLVVERIEFRQKGGGSSTSASINVIEVGAASLTASAGLGTTQKDVATTGQAETVLIEVSNSTGSTINAAPRVQGYITGV